jgi:hypothetical protein
VAVHGPAPIRTRLSDDLFASIRDGKPINEANRAASSMTGPTPRDWKKIEDGRLASDVGLQPKRITSDRSAGHAQR